jgi:hypothetical protein
MQELFSAHDLNAVTWDGCDNLWVFGEFFADEYRCPVPPPDRQFRLLVVAALRAVWGHISDPRSRAAVEAAERYADTRQPAVLTAAEQDAERAYEEAGKPWDARDPAKCLAHRMACAALQALDPDLSSDPRVPPWADTVTYLESDEVLGRTAAQAKALHSRLFHDIFSNPFRPTSASPAWQTPQVVALARATYDEREMPTGTLDLARLAILADALEDAGCTDADILGHLRGPGPHVRGCWAVDVLLGKA